MSNPLNDYNNQSSKVQSFLLMLAKATEQVKPSDKLYKIYDPDFGDDFSINIEFNTCDMLFEIHPHFELNEDDLYERIEHINHGDYGKVFDEHGKLICSFRYVQNEEEFHTNHIFDHRLFDRKADNSLFFKRNLNLGKVIEDYKLKQLIERYISIIKAHRPNVVAYKHPYGSSDLSHLLWMLEDIHEMRRSISERYMFLGYIQGMLYNLNYIDIKHERDVMNDLL